MLKINKKLLLEMNRNLMNRIWCKSYYAKISVEVACLLNLAFDEARNIVIHNGMV